VQSPNRGGKFTENKIDDFPLTFRLLICTSNSIFQINID